MYRHLLVPLDDSRLSVDTVSRAVELARALGARITFFHAQADYGASSLGALERVLSPPAFNDHVAGIGRAVLGKAEVAARAAGVPYDSAMVVSDRPHEAILEAAVTRGCDLIFMASHGQRGIRGLLLGSQTQRVLQYTTIPVLVCTVESNVTEAAITAPLAIINDEHRSIAAVVSGLEFLVREIRAGRRAASFPLLNGIVHYIRAFPETLHHPKEEAYLFRRLRERTPEFNETLDELTHQHAASHEAVAALEISLAHYEAEPNGGFADFAAAAARFAALQWPHMSLENKVILPATRKYLTPEDWAQIAQAFAENGDPRFSVEADDEFRALFARILNLTPQHPAAGDTRP